MKINFSLCVLIPCHNEALSIQGVVREYGEEFPGAEILVIDNASTDGTAAEALQAGARVIVEARLGKANAVAAGLENCDADLIIMVDGDGSYPAKGARLLWDRYLEYPADLITGVRCPTEEQGPVFRPMHQLGTKLFGLCASAVFGCCPRDIFSGLRLFSRRFYKNVPILSNGFELEMELAIQAADKGFSWSEVDVPFRDRTPGSSSKLRTVTDGCKILRSLLLLFRDYKPLYFFGAIAGVFLMLGLCAGAPPIYEYYRTHFVGRFPLAILAAALMNIALFTFLTGLVAETNLRYHREAFQIKLRNFQRHQ
ncbi:MAG: hypothetical protein B9S32_07670 [Verrucomicrobia bacterium Tous-C9LFEB]|nr:MAG: hypothetical protein B9S32_07670 [Verrucomicrobia bacterium Tous-C9LFEB]